MIKAKQSLKSKSIILILLSVFIFIYVAKSPVSHTNSDPRASLLLSQNILAHHTMRLDNLTGLEKYGYVITKKNNHYYYDFPMGSSISSIPFVFVFTQVFGMDMSDMEQEKVAQKIIAGFISALIFLTLYNIAKLYLPVGQSIFFAFTFWAGTALSSTLGQALWSSDFAMLYAYIAIYIMLMITRHNIKYSWLLLPVILFAAYLTRPTMSLLSVAVVLYLFFNNRKATALKTVLVFSLLFSAFILYSISEFHQLLPDYYSPKRLYGNSFWTAFMGNTISPSRGILVFSPFLLAFLFSIRDFILIFIRKIPLLLFAGWIILHLVVISKFPHWWGGFSYGPRLMIETFVPFYLLFIEFISQVDLKSKSLGRTAVIIFMVISIPASVYFNSIQGLYNMYSGLRWNINPNIDRNPQYLFDWKYPQFLHNKKRYKQRISEFNSAENK